MEELEGWVIIGKYVVVLCIIAGMCYTAFKIAEMFV